MMNVNSPFMRIVTVFDPGERRFADVGDDDTNSSEKDTNETSASPKGRFSWTLIVGC